MDDKLCVCAEKEIGEVMSESAHGALQESEYDFPYHYLASLDSGVPSTRRFIFWGWEYLTYMTYLKKKISAISPASLLDVGCGDGYMVNQLCRMSFPGVLRGVDTSDRAITFAQAFCPRGKETFAVQDIFKMEQQSEMVSMIEVIEHIPDAIVGPFLQKAFSLSSKYVLISVPTTAFPLQKKHYRHYDEALLAEQTAFASEAFDLVESVRIYDEKLYLKVLKKLLENRYFAFTNKFLLRKIWQYHQSHTSFARAPKGYHLVALYKRKQ